MRRTGPKLWTELSNLLGMRGKRIAVPSTCSALWDATVPVVVMALLMAIEEMALADAYQLVRAQRPCIRPKYMRVLAEFELRLGRKESSRPEFLDTNAVDSKSFGALF